MKIVLIIINLFLLAHAVSAQEKLTPNRTVNRKIESGKSEVLSISLNDGDYVNVSVGFKGKLDFFLLNPDGTIARRLIGQNEAKASFPFAAEGSGAYSFKFENRGDQAVSYELTTGEVIPLNDRFKPQPWTDPFPSPRIQALRKQIAAGQTNTDSFWKQVAAEGTPLVEPFGSDFLAKELVPWVRSHYNVTKDPKQTVVTGYSAGGLASTYVALRHPHVFGNVLSLSGAYWWSFEHHGGVCGPRCPDSGGRGGDESNDSTTEGNSLVKDFIASPKLPLRFYLAAGTFEIDREGTGGNILEATRHLRDVLRAKGYDVHYQQFVGGHDGVSWRGLLADGLMVLFGPR